MVRYLALTGALAGCHNPCQQVCVRMADYAEECAFTVSEADVDACVEAQSDPEDPSVCRDYGNAAQIREEWTCEDLGIYFQ